MGGHVGAVVGMTTGSRLGVDELAIDGDLEHAAARRDQPHLIGLAELVEDLLRHAHGTACVVSRTAELDRDVLHDRSPYARPI